MSEHKVFLVKHRRRLFPPFPIRVAIDLLDSDPDDSGARCEFLKALAAYMLDKGIEQSGLEIALAYEKRDRSILEENDLTGEKEY